MRKIIILTILIVVGLASYYGQGDGYAWKTMANGQLMDPNKMTCASWNYPLGTLLEVSHGNKSIVVTVTDRGGYKNIDLSAGAFKKLAPLSRGIIKVKIKELPKERK